MRILLIGGTGFISGEIARLAVGAGHAVTLFHRHAASGGALPALAGDAERLPEHAAALREIAPDLVVHSVCHSEQHARDLLAVFAGTDARLLVLGSQDCYAAFQDTARGRDTADFPIGEDDPLTPIRHYYRDRIPGSRQDYDKNLMTAVLLEAWERGAARSTVFRLPMVYGPRDRQFAHRHGSIIRRIHDRHSAFVIGARDQGTIWPFGYVTNVAAAVVHAFDRPELAGRVYNIGEARFRTRRRWAELYAAAAGFEFEFKVLPDEWLGGDPDAPPAHLIVDNTRYIRETGFSEPVALDQAIRETLEWGLAHPEHLGPVPDYPREAELLSALPLTAAAPKRRP